MTQANITGLNLIAGRWIGGGDATTRAVSPTTGQPLEPAFKSATPQEIDAAFAAAQSAFEATRDLPAVKWAGLLDTIAEEIMALGDQLITTGQAESALPAARLQAERGRTTGQLKLFAAMLREGSWVDAVIDTPDPARQPLPKPDLRRMARPIGPVVVFDASNFPFAFGPCGGDTASAFAAGNPVLVKAHSAHPATDELFARAVLASLEKTGMPLGLFALLHGSGSVVGAAMMKHPRAQAVGFTGSKAGGRALFDIAAARPTPIPVFAEMGSLNPVAILPDALAQRAEAIAEGLAGSVTLGGGQMCTKPGLAFVIDSPNADRFVAALTAKLSATPPVTMLNPGIQKAFAESLTHLRATPGTTTRVAGAISPPAVCAASLLEVNSDTFRKQTALHEEAFGPATLVVRCANADDLIATLEFASGNLTGSLHAGANDDADLVKRVARKLESLAGRFVFNGFPTGVEVCHAMVHGGPYPATTAPNSTSVGTLSIRRFTRPVAFQNVPDHLLPPALQNANPLSIDRRIDGRLTRDAIQPKA